MKGWPGGMAKEVSRQRIRRVISPFSSKVSDAKQYPPLSVSHWFEFPQSWWTSQAQISAWLLGKDTKQIKSDKYGVIVVLICVFAWFIFSAKDNFCCEVFFCYFCIFRKRSNGKTKNKNILGINNRNNKVLVNFMSNI